MGDSHVGSIKRGWDNISRDYPEKEITFFAQRATGLSGLIPKDGKLVPDNDDLANALKFTSGGKDEIDPDVYDIFVIYGTDAKVDFIKSNQFFSRAVIERSLNDFVANTLSFTLLKKIKTLTNKIVFIGHRPLVSATQVASQAFPTDYIERLELINKVIYRPLNSEMIQQPLSTIVNGMNTHPEFSKGSKRLAIGDGFDNELHPIDDNVHMNDKFGELWLTQFMLNYVKDKITAETS